MSVIKQGVTVVSLTASESGQRLDNFLFRYWKKVPRSKIYKVIRTGQIRLDKKRVKASTKLYEGGHLRLPPIYFDQAQTPAPVVKDHMAQALKDAILYESDDLLVLNKPSGWAVHGGSGISLGVIEAIRQMRPQSDFLELAHRLDRETSGCLILAKKRSALKALAASFRLKEVKKSYLVMVHGQWPKRKQWVKDPLKRCLAGNGERFVRVDYQNGQAASTGFEVLRSSSDFTLLQAQPITGRTHQIRVHCANIGHPVVGDAKYGEPGAALSFPSETFKHLLGKRHFLHCSALSFEGECAQHLSCHEFQAPLPAQLEQLIESLQWNNSSKHCHGF